MLIQKLYADEEANMKSFAKIYGTFLPMQLTVERNCLAQIGRLPGEKRSLLSIFIILLNINIK